MGCFSNDAPTYTPPAPPTLPTASQLYGEATNWANTNFPTQMGAQASALQNANDPNYYAKFQPTSFEQALGQQQFQNIWPDEQAQIMNQLSKSGMAYSPVAASTIGNSYGKLATGIGEYLNTQANTRATNSINAGLSVSPMNFINPYVGTGQQQGNNQANLDYGYQQSLAQQMNDYQQQQAFAQMLGYVSPVAGNIYNATQGNLGSGLGGTFQSVQQFAPLAMSAATGPFGNSFSPMSSGTGPGSTSGMTLSGMTQNSANAFNPDIGSNLGTGQYNQPSAFGNNSMSAGFNNAMAV